MSINKIINIHPSSFFPRQGLCGVVRGSTSEKRPIHVSERGRTKHFQMLKCFSGRMAYTWLRMGCVKSIYFDSLPLSLSAPGSLSYFGLHSVSTGDELGVAPSFFGQPVDEGRTGSPANTKRETPEGQYIKTRVKGNWSFATNTYLIYQLNPMQDRQE